jgi:hypothetical protein
VDSQQLEIIGRGHLMASLLDGGIEVALPIRDRGVDLIAYVDQGSQFDARPIQLKTSARPTFAVWEKYSKIAGLLIVHVWLQPAVEILAMTYGQSLAAAQHFNWTSTNSWREKGYYRTPSPTKTHVEYLNRHLIQPSEWRELITVK